MKTKFDRTNIDFFLRNISSIDKGTFNSFRLYQKLKALTLFEFLVLIDDMTYESVSLSDENKNSLFVNLLFFLAENSNKYITEPEFEIIFKNYNRNDDLVLTSYFLIRHFKYNSILEVKFEQSNYSPRDYHHHHSNPYIEFEEGHDREWELTHKTHHIGACFMSYIREIYFIFNNGSYAEILFCIFRDSIHHTFYSELLSESVYDILEEINEIEDQDSSIQTFKPLMKPQKALVFLLKKANPNIDSKILNKIAQDTLDAIFFSKKILKHDYKLKLTNKLIVDFFIFLAKEKYFSFHKKQTLFPTQISKYLPINIKGCGEKQLGNLFRDKLRVAKISSEEENYSKVKLDFGKLTSENRLRSVMNSY